MPWIVGGAILGGAALSAYSGSQAANSAEDAAADTNATNLYMYNRSRKDQRKWRRAGKQGLNALQDPNSGIGTFQFDLQGDQGYNFARDEALRGTSRQFAAQGGRNSGNVLAALSDRGAGIASQYTNDAWNRQFGEYGDRLNRYQALAGLGQTANGQVAQSGAYAAQGIGQANAMNADAGYYRAGSMNNAVQGGISNYLTYDYLNGGRGGGASPYTNNSINGYTSTTAGR